MRRGQTSWGIASVASSRSGFSNLLHFIVQITGVRVTSKLPPSMLVRRLGRDCTEECPIKGNVKRHFSPPAGRPRILWCIQPPQQPLCVTVPVMLIGRGPLAPAARQRIPIPSGFMLVIVTTPFVFLKRTSTRWLLGRQPWSYRRLVGLLLSSVIRGGIGWSLRLGGA